MFDGHTGEPLPGEIGSFLAYDPGFTGGVNVASADLNADGFADVVTAADADGGPHIRAFSGRDGSLLLDFFAFEPNFMGGVHVAVADMNGDTVLDIIAGCGVGGPPEVRVFDGRSLTLQVEPLELLGSFLAYDRAFTGGVFVAAGDLNGDRQNDIITGAAKNGGPHVRAFDGRSLTLRVEPLPHPLADFMAYDPAFTGGVRVATANIDGDGRADLVIAPGAGGTSRLHAFRGATGAEITNFKPYPAAFEGGVFIGGYTPALPLGILVDPLVVFDANDALVLSPDRIENEISNWSVDLRAQLYGAIADTYEWDLSAAPTAINITGDDTPRLQLDWYDVFTPTTNIITLTVIDTDEVEHVQIIEFLVEPNNEIDQLTTAETWPAAVSPDKLQAAQEMIAGPTYALSLATGAVYTSHGLPSYNASAGNVVASAPPALVYSSLAADARPIFIDHFEIDPEEAVAPPVVSAKLTLDGVTGTEVFYDTSLLNPGNFLQIALQADATGLATGRYDYEIEITSHYMTPVAVMHSGQVNIINHADSPIGVGWSLAGVDRLWPVDGGVILEISGEPGASATGTGEPGASATGTGEPGASATGASLWFEEDGMGGYLMPPGDTSMLMQNMDDSFTRTFKNGVKVHFDDDGFQTSIVDRNENTAVFAYTTGMLTSITDAVGLVTDLAYTDGLLVSITDPADRVTAIGHDMAGQLTSITDADDALWEYAYADNLLDTITDPRENSTAFTYNFAGRASVVTRADASEEGLVANQMQGLVPPMQGTEMNPAVPTLAVESAAEYTDPRGQVWQTRLDWLGFGRAVQTIDPLLNQTDIHREVARIPI